MRHAAVLTAAVLLTGTFGAVQSCSGARTVTATLNEPSGAQGTATFTETSDGVEIKISLTAVPGDGQHGLHLHATGDCADNAGADGGSVHHGAAGGHYNPTDAGHACPPTDPRHAGDLGNITISSGAGTLDLHNHELTLDTVVGKALILHSGTDDCSTQPTGNSGGRIGCVVIPGTR